MTRSMRFLRNVPKEKKTGFLGFLKGKGAKPDKVKDSALSEHEGKVTVEEVKGDAEEKKKGLFGFLRGKGAKPDHVKDSALSEHEKKVTVEPGPHKEGERVVKQDKVVDSALESREAKASVPPEGEVPEQSALDAVEEKVTATKKKFFGLFGKAK